MDIAAMASMMKQSTLHMNVALSVIKLGMDASTSNSDALVRMMEQSVNPNLGANLDIRL